MQVFYSGAHADVVPGDGRTRRCGERSTTSNPPNPILLQSRGARRRKNKALRGVKHHVQPAEIRFCSKDVVPGDERTRHCGERSTTFNRPKSDFAPKTWCPATEEQGFAGSEAPRPTRRSPILSQRRGARRRKNKALGGSKHHVQPAEPPSGLKGVVPDDEEQDFADNIIPIL